MLTLFGIIAIVIFTFQAYKSARDTERNAPIWALMTALAGIAFQFVIPFFIGLIIVVFYIATGKPVENLESALMGPGFIIGIVFLVLSFVAMFLILKQSAQIKDDPPASEAAQPPPPPTF
jgi:hypothetical protein